MKSNGPSADFREARSSPSELVAPNTLDFDGYAEGVLGLGPGNRVALWVRGCDRHCPGCIAPELWKGGDKTPVEEVASLLVGPLTRADGLTISGGEPFLQAEALTALIGLVRRQVETEVLVYTGYTVEELRAGPPAWRKLLSNIDILIDGPYIEEEANTLRWRGSDNQRVHLLTPKALRHNGVQDLKWPEHRSLSVQMLSPTRFRLIGIPERGDLQNLRRLLRERGLEVISSDE